MDELSEEQVIDRLFAVENEGLAEERAELTGERFLSLIHDDESGRAFVFRHGTDDTEGAEVPEGTEFWEYPRLEEAQRVYRELLQEARQNGELVEEDSDEDVGDSETGGAEVRDRYAASDEDRLTADQEEDDGT
jgi:ketosteroid isomerase-like protein